MRHSRTRNARWAAATVLAVGLLFSLATAAIGCEKKMDPKECDRIRGEAFKNVLNVAQPCANDGDCKEAEWPECRKPVNKKNFDALAEMNKQVTDGKCEQKTAECKDSPPVYCKQGLCVNREPGEIRDPE